jgi:hypothetical protein
MLAAHRERLAGWATSHKVNAIGDASPVEGANVPLVNIPASNEWVSACAILTHRVACPLVPLDNRLRLEASKVDPHSQSASAREQFNAFHLATLPTRKRLSFRASASLFFNSHSQMTNTRHFAALSAAILRASRSLLPSSFFVQNCTLDFGIRARAHPLCLCQKHPWTKITARRERKTKSGVPGRSRQCRRYLKPMPCTSLRTAISGLVSTERTNAIRRLRSLGDSVSAIVIFRPRKLSYRAILTGLTATAIARSMAETTTLQFAPKPLRVSQRVAMTGRQSESYCRGATALSDSDRRMVGNIVQQLSKVWRRRRSGESMLMKSHGA